MKKLFLFAIACFCYVSWGCSKQELVSTGELSGDYALTASGDPLVSVSFEKKQKIRLGIDAKRLWYWRRHLKDSLAQLAVGDMHTDYVRVPVRCAYEREEDVIKESAYSPVWEMMEAMKNVNPDIDFFASPGPLNEAYNNAERIEIWGHQDNVPWSPFPAWILEFDSVGTKTMNDGTVVPRWRLGDFHVDKLVQYFADYLNLMKVKGFDIAYLDLTNEKSVVTPAHSKYIKEHLPEKLNAGVQMPELVAPSAYGVQASINWLDRIDFSKNEQHGFDIASTHDTGLNGSKEEFATKVHGMGKEAWNTEMHRWVGIELHDEIMNSDIFWEHMRAGFNGVDSWLFFGPHAGKGHTMLWAHPRKVKIIKSGKYEIFKQVVNHASGGKYVDVNLPSEKSLTAAFMKDDILSVWILNQDTTALANTKFEMGNKDISGKTVEVIKWHGDLPRAGADTSFLAGEPYHFNYDIAGESLYFFKIDLGD